MLKLGNRGMKRWKYSIAVTNRILTSQVSIYTVCCCSLQPLLFFLSNLSLNNHDSQMVIKHSITERGQNLIIHNFVE